MIGASFRSAEQAHQQLITIAVKPVQEKYNALNAQILSLEQEIKKEKNGDGVTGTAGIGNETISLIRKRNNLAPQLYELKSSFDNIEKLLTQSKNLKSYNPDDIFRIDQAIWEGVPLTFRPNKTAYEGPKRENYFEESSRFKLLAPLLKLTGKQQSGQSDMSSTAALVLASVIDGVSIMLGTAIDKRARRAPFEGLASSLGQIIWGAKSAGRTITHYSRQKGRRYMNTTPAQSTMAREAVYLVQLRLNGKGSHFLETFLGSIDPVNKEINFDQLKQHSNSTFRTGFQLLVEAFRHPSLNWVDVKENPVKWFFLDADSYYEFHKWLSEEIIYQAEKEESAGLSQEELNASKVVQLRTPLLRAS